MSRFDYQRVVARLERALRESDGRDEREAHDIAFHMLDWEEELWPIVELLLEPETKTNAEVLQALSDFLNHAPAHIVAARKLFTGDPTEDVFEIGAVAVGEES